MVKGSNAGVINITTKKPRPGESDGFIQYEDGDFNTTENNFCHEF